MAIVINCGEQDIEGNGICVSMTIYGDKEKDSPKEIFTHIIDNLLGVSEFIANCGCDFAQVGFDYNGGFKDDLDSKEYLDLNNFIEKEGNEKLKEIFHKYVSYQMDDPILDDGVLWYYFELDNIKAEITEEDLAEFSKIFRINTKCTI